MEYQNLVDIIKNDWLKLIKLWKYIGFKDKTFIKRNCLLKKALIDQLNDIKEGEYELRERIENDIKQYKVKINEMLQRLNIDKNALIDDFNNDDNETFHNGTHTTLYDEEMFYKKLLRKLEKIKSERKQKLNELKAKERELCHAMNENSYSIHDS